MNNTQYITLSIILLIWLIITLILAMTVIGWVLLLPQRNETKYQKPQQELRSSWMRIGTDIKNKLLF